MYLRVDPTFKHELSEVPGGETFKYCYQCGTCTATCPISRYTDVFRPNKIIQLAKLGIRNIVHSDAVWLCVNCYSCTERCPQGVKVADVMRALKNIAVKEGHIPDYSRSFLTNILTAGSVYTIPLSRIKRREALSLSPLPPTKVTDLQKLVEITQTVSLLKKRQGS
jgi:heterodisulfide reductase subunit C